MDNKVSLLGFRESNSALRKLPFAQSFEGSSSSFNPTIAERLRNARFCPFHHHFQFIPPPPPPRTTATVYRVHWHRVLGAQKARKKEIFPLLLPLAITIRPGVIRHSRISCHDKEDVIHTSKRVEEYIYILYTYIYTYMYRWRIARERDGREVGLSVPLCQ